MDTNAAIGSQSRKQSENASNGGKKTQEDEANVNSKYRLDDYAAVPKTEEKK